MSGNSLDDSFMKQRKTVSNRVICSKFARIGVVPCLNLERRVHYSETMFETFAGFCEETIVERGTRPHQMRSQRGFGRAHRPDMEIVHVRNTGQRREIALDLHPVDLRRHHIERQVDGVARKRPRAPQDRKRNRNADCGIEPEPVCVENDARRPRPRQAIRRRPPPCAEMHPEY